MPYDVAYNVSVNVGHLSKHTAGGRVAFTTNSKRIKIIVTYDNLGFFL